MMDKYKFLSKQGEGTFSEVVKVQNKISGKFSAIKCMKAKYENLEDVNSLREIQALRRLSPHPNIIILQEVLFDKPTGRLALVFEFMDINMLELIQDRKQRLASDVIKVLIFQVFSALKHMHNKGIFHRDIKPENILIKNETNVVKIADLGSCRGVYQKPPFTEYISTRWYRAPECLLTDGCYGAEMDIWGAGCVLFEITTLYPLFPGSDEIDQINRIHKILGTPSKKVLGALQKKCSSERNFDFPAKVGSGIESLMPFAAKDGIDFLSKTLAYEIEKRITADQSINHPYFWDVKNVGEKETLPSVTGATETRSSQRTHKWKPLQNDYTIKSGLPSINTKTISKKSYKASSLLKKSSSFKKDVMIDESSIPLKCSRRPIHERIRSSIQLPSIYHSNTVRKGERRRKKDKLPELEKSPITATERRRRLNKLYQNVQSSGYGYGKSNRFQNHDFANLSPVSKTANNKARDHRKKNRKTDGHSKLVRHRSLNKQRDRTHRNDGIT